MQVIALSAVQNQQFTVTLDNNRYEIAIYLTDDVMCCDINCNDVQLTTGMRAQPGAPLIPFQFLQGLNGNFFIVTSDDDYPNYNDFGTTQYLIYLSYVEFVAAGKSVPSITFLTLNAEPFTPVVGILLEVGDNGTFAGIGWFNAVVGNLEETGDNGTFVGAGNVGGIIGYLIETGDNGHWAGNP